MKRFLIIILLSVSLFSCKNKSNTPDVSNISIALTEQRFENDFFKMDTTNVISSLNNLKSSYPVFMGNFIQQILGFTNQTPADTLSKYVKFFIRDYKFVTVSR
ncbi:MAG: hypothetical protein NVS3B19_12350 [Ginsengibacter sp.]